MRIGLTFDLREEYLAEGYTEHETAEFDREDTIEAIEGVLRNLGHTPDRIGNIRKLVLRLASGDSWDLVFNIAEGLSGYGRESQVPALLDAYGIPYTFSDPLVLAITLHKGIAKRVIRDCGLPTADFSVVQTEEDVANISFPFPLFVKPIAEGTGKGISCSSKVLSKGELQSVCRNLLNQYKQPVLVETFLSGREFTVGICGTGKNAAVVGVMEIILRDSAEADAYSYSNKEKFEEKVEYRLVNDSEAEKAKEIALAAWKVLGCRDGGRVDLRSDAFGTPNFLEVNPLAGLHPMHSDLPIVCRLNGINYEELLKRILNSALIRVERALV